MAPSSKRTKKRHRVSITGKSQAPIATLLLPVEFMLKVAQGFRKFFSTRDSRAGAER
jgi:hypothetical protein